MKEYPLRSNLHNLDALYKVSKWAIKLGQHEIIYRPRSSIKAQALANFVSDSTPAARDTVNASDSQGVPDNPCLWKLYVDESLNIKREGAWMVLVMPDGSILEQALKLGFKESNDEVEYKALLAGLKVA